MIIPDMSTELSLLTYEKLEVERPGFPGEVRFSSMVARHFSLLVVFAIIFCLL